MKAKRYVRRVSALERYSLFLNGVYRYHVDGIVEGIGDVDPGVLQVAVDHAADANPAIRVRLRGWLARKKWVDSGIAPRVRLLPRADWDGNSERGAPFLEERLDARGGGPIADVLIVPCSDGHTRLVFRTLHAAIDGRGCMHWILEVCRALRSEALEGSDSTLTDLDVQEQYRDQLVEEPAGPPLTGLPVILPAEAGSAERTSLHYVWRRVMLDRRMSQLLPKTAVFLAEWARRRQAGDVIFTVPIDYRGLRIQEMGIGNLTGYLRLTIEPDATARSVVQQLNQKIRAYADCRPFPGINSLIGLPDWLIMWRLRPGFERELYTANPGQPSGGIVSMGNFRLEHYDFPGFKATGVLGIPGAAGKFNVIFLSLPDRISVSFAAPAAYNHLGQLDELVDAYQRHFSSAGYSH